MFLLVSVRHVGAHPGGHQHGVSIQISINLGKTFLRISRIRNILGTWILAKVFVYVPPLISHIPDFIYWTVFIFILIYFEWHDCWKPAMGAFNNFFLPNARNCGYARMKDLGCAMDSQGIVVMCGWKIYDAQWIIMYFPLILIFNCNLNNFACAKTKTMHSGR